MSIAMVRYIQVATQRESEDLRLKIKEATVVVGLRGSEARNTNLLESVEKAMYAPGKFTN